MRPSKFRKQLRHIQKHSRIFLNIKWLYWTSLYVFRKVKNMFFRLKITVITVNALVLSNGAARVCKYDENCNNNYSKWPTAKVVYQKIASHLPVYGFVASIQRVWYFINYFLLCSFPYISIWRIKSEIYRWT